MASFSEQVTRPGVGQPVGDDQPTVAEAGFRQQWATYEQGATGARATFYDPDVTPAYGTRVPRPQTPADPLAVAVGNASLLGIGYFLLGRKVLGVAAVLVTVALLFVLLSVTPTLWFEFVVVAWWVAVVGHGWALARRRPRPRPVRTQRVTAFAVALPVLLAFGLLRFDAARIEDDITAARAGGDCEAALAATGSFWFGHDLADAPLTERAGATVRACDQLRTAGRVLDSSLEGDTGALAAGFGDLTDVLTGLPGHEEMVRSTVDGFVRALPVDDPCDTSAITDWLRKKKPGGALSAASEVVPQVAPSALVECADAFMATSDWDVAKLRYQQLLDEYPDHELAPKARAGVTKATQAIELANVRALLTTSGGSVPAYCATPAAYSAAKPYVPNAPNRALVYGNEAHTGKIPPAWRAKDAADAVVVICAGETEYGTPVQTCPYEAGSSLSPYGYTDVTFHKIAIPLRVFEVRTGKLVAQFKLEIGGASCPAVLEYRTSSYVDLGPPSQVYVTASITDVQGAFRPMLVP
ncbi:tetratricopeptide repeat protein [Actinophytocola glycyrrhizae]|uniref:Tol-pal system YbgF family protein n=1 Tax=Actinophytocola glycyrrhizae TaxID=2044873 RepID=A0ABV9SCC3_9PSEU